jgi:hypothetical protein
MRATDKDLRDRVARSMRERATTTKPTASAYAQCAACDTHWAFDQYDACPKCGCKTIRATENQRSRPVKTEELKDFCLSRALTDLPLCHARIAELEKFANEAWRLSVLAQAEIDNGDPACAAITLVQIAEGASRALQKTPD